MLFRSQVVVVSMPIGLAMFVTAALVSGQFSRITEFSPHSLGILASAGVIHFVVGRYCGYRSIQAMGANLASPVQQWSLLVTLTLAIVYLGEVLDLLKITGIALMVLGPSLVVGARRLRTARKAAQLPANGSSSSQEDGKAKTGGASQADGKAQADGKVQADAKDRKSTRLNSSHT